MFQTILHVTGLDRKLETLKFEIEGKANQAISHIKAVGLQIAVATALAVAAVIFTALAILAGFVLLFVWLQPPLRHATDALHSGRSPGLDCVGVHGNRSGRRKKATGSYQSVGTRE